ncbi:phosphoheptose isomerase [Legionella lytica]|uniref:Phosphoheptose isomerase n=1 Tax=Legionella lytica TaxID=96232 RepID=A0ABW8D7G9_9GAMM
MFLLLRKFFNFLTIFFKLYFPEKNYLYKIEEINECLNRVVISCRGKGATLVSTIEDIGYDQYIITSLPPHQACWIGYYFGKSWGIKKSQKKTNLSSPHQTSQKSNYRIICQDRMGNIIYQSTQNRAMYKMDPIELAKSKTIILFNSSQAFYIGFLAGLKNTKDIKKINVNKPILKLVK